MPAADVVQQVFQQEAGTGRDSEVMVRVHDRQVGAEDFLRQPGRPPLAHRKVRRGMLPLRADEALPIPALVPEAGTA